MIPESLLTRLSILRGDRSLISGGEFLEELKELGFPIVQVTLSNFVARAWITREHIDVAPSGVGQTGYFQRQMLVPAVLACVLRRDAKRYVFDRIAGRTIGKTAYVQASFEAFRQINEAVRGELRERREIEQIKEKTRGLWGQVGGPLVATPPARA